jgi:hypothetical protein
MKTVLLISFIFFLPFVFAQSGSSVEYQTGTTFEVSSGAMFEADAISGGGTIIGAENIYIGGSPLPIELISFSAKLINNSVFLEWETATETNNYGFEIERASTSLSTRETNFNVQNQMDNWQKIGFVSGNGNSNSSNKYTFTDNNPPFGILKYRLKQIDSDGTNSYSNEIEIELKSIPNEFALSQNYPNPFGKTTNSENSSTKISWQSPVNSWQTLKVYDILGNEIATLVDEYKEAGKHQVDFSVETRHPDKSGRVASSLPSGVYFYRLTSGSYSEVKKMILSR